MMCPMSEKSPWWQTTKTVRQGLWLGCGFAIAGLIEVAFAGTGQVNLPIVIGGAGFLTIGLGHLASAIAMRRRQRSNSAQDAGPAMRDSTHRPSNP
jgi:hypothetical protein